MHSQTQSCKHAFRNAEFDIMFNEGISRSGDLVDLAVADSIVKKSGAWFSYGDVRLGQGRENSKQFLRENPDLFDEIKKKVLAHHLGTPVAEAESEPKAE